MLDDDPVAYWPLDAGGEDLSGNGHALTFHSGAEVTTSSGLWESSLDLSATEAFAEVVDSGAFQLEGPLTYEAWVYAGDSSWDGGQGAQIVGNNDRVGVRRCNTGSNVCWTVRNDSGSDIIASSWGLSTSMTFGQWSHVVAVFDGTEGAIYVDGVRRNDAPGSGSAATSVTAPFTLGAQYEHSDGSGDVRRFFDGRLAHVAVYDTALSSEAIEERYAFRD